MVTPGNYYNPADSGRGLLKLRMRARDQDWVSFAWFDLVQSGELDAQDAAAYITNPVREDNSGQYPALSVPGIEGELQVFEGDESVRVVLPTGERHRLENTLLEATLPGWDANSDPEVPQEPLPQGSLSELMAAPLHTLGGRSRDVRLETGQTLEFTVSANVEGELSAVGVGGIDVTTVQQTLLGPDGEVIDTATTGDIRHVFDGRTYRYQVTAQGNGLIRISWRNRG